MKKIFSMKSLQVNIDLFKFLRWYSHSIGVCFFILKVSPEQRPYEDAFQLYLYCNKERELPE